MILQMTNFLHWRKMTRALVLWSGYIVAWMMITGSGPVIVTVWWLAGFVVLGPLWFATQPLFQQARGLDGLFIWPSWTHWRVVNLHRTPRGTEPRRDAS